MFRLVGQVLRGLIAAAILLALMAGLPWALCHYIGWPLPNHIPTWAEVQVVLLSPMTTAFLLDVLACLCWIIWAVFTIDVARCTLDVANAGIHAARWPDFSGTGPMRALVGVLVAAVLLAVLGNRTTATSASSPASASGATAQVAATAPAWQHPAATITVHDAAFASLSLLFNQVASGRGPC